MRTFTRVANMSPGLRDTGDEIDAAHINELQQAAEDLQTGALPIALPGIAAALDDRVIAADADDPAERQTLRPRISDLKPRWVDGPSFFGRDYLSGDLSEDASTGLAALVEDMQINDNPGGGVKGGNCEFEPGTYRLTETLDLTRFTGRFGGAGIGKPSDYTVGGHGTIFRWDGAAGQPMFRVRDSQNVIFENFRMEGKDGAAPSYGIEFVSTSGEGAGTNGYLTMRDLHIGRYPWTSQGVNKGDVVSGIGFTGDNGNNDSFRIERVGIFNPSQYGLYLPNSQSVGGSATNLLVANAGVAGVAAGATTRLINPEFYACACDLETLSSNANVTVVGVYSEHSLMMLRTVSSASIAYYGGLVQLGDIIANGLLMIDAYPCDRFSLTLDTMNFTGNTDPSKARIEFGPSNEFATDYGRFFINVRGCLGLSSAQIVLHANASMWATVPMSKGVVEWQSVRDNSIYQFRNELRKSGTGTRTTLDKTVWDAPVTD